MPERQKCYSEKVYIFRKIYFFEEWNFPKTYFSGNGAFDPQARKNIKFLKTIVLPVFRNDC